ncbi:MAG TPA: glycosyltransferase family 1 protein [Vicinamibacteria bacterium]|nr:glycosyltransferase family 1 protein [Vicinamibacteria bacterium]
MSPAQGPLGTGALTIGVDARELQGRPTGTGRYLRNLLRLWTAGADDRFVAYFNGPPPADPVLAHPRILCRGLPSRRGLFWQERSLPEAARTDGIQVFFSPAYTCPLALHVPRVTAVHDLSFFSHPQDFGALDGLRRRVLVAASIRASRTVLACSEFTRREIAGRFPDCADRILHVPLGPDDDLPPPPPRAEARARRGARGPYLLTVGAVLNRRCLPELLHAVALLRRPWPRLRLDVIGENRTHPRLDLEGLVQMLDLGGHVRLAGFADEATLAECYAAADAAVFLSEYEGFGLPALEAAARGVPLLVSRRPALGEIFGEAALVVEPRDVTAVAGALDRLLSEQALRESLVSRGRALAARYSWAETARQTLGAMHGATP